MDPNAGRVRWNRELHRPSQPSASGGAFDEPSRDTEVRRARHEAEDDDEELEQKS